MDEFTFELLSDEYEERVGDLLSVCNGAKWDHHKAWLAPTEILLKDYSVDERSKNIQLHIRWVKIHNAEKIAFHEYVTTFSRLKNDLPERIWEYSNIAAFYYVWSQRFKQTQPGDACKALLGAIRVLMKLIGMLEALELANIQEKREEKKMVARGKGGKAKNERYDSVKQEIIRLLQHKVTGQYAAKQAAAEDILEDAWQFSHRLTEEINAENKKLPTSKQTRKAPGLVRENLIRQMLDWSRKDEAVSAAFNRVVQPRKGRSAGRSQVEHEDEISE